MMSDVPFIISNAASASEAMEELATSISRAVQIPPYIVLDYVMKRENIRSTTLDIPIAIPHAKLPCDNVAISILRPIEPIVWFNGKLIELVIMMVSPVDKVSLHIRTLAHLCQVFRDGTVLEKAKKDSISEEIKANVNS